MREMNKEAFLRQLAERSNFTIGDIKDIWKCVEEIFEDAIRGRITLNIRGFGKMYFTKVKKRKGYNAGTGKHQNFPATERVSIRISENFRNILK